MRGPSIVKSWCGCGGCGSDCVENICGNSTNMKKWKVSFVNKDTEHSLDTKEPEPQLWTPRVTTHKNPQLTTLSHNDWYRNWATVTEFNIEPQWLTKAPPEPPNKVKSCQIWLTLSLDNASWSLLLLRNHTYQTNASSSQTHVSIPSGSGSGIQQNFLSHIHEEKWIPLVGFI